MGRVCVTPIHFIQSNSVRYDTSPLYSCVRTAAMFGLHAPCESQSCSNCEVQQAYIPITTANHEFNV